MSERNGFINRETLTDAIMNTVGMPPEERVGAENMAEVILGFFGFYERVIDNSLEPKERDLFYKLQDYGILKTERTETTLWDGKDWRIHYWRMNVDKITKMSVHQEEAEEDSEEKKIISIYENLSDEDWGIETYDGSSWLDWL